MLLQHWKQHRQDCIPHGAEVVKKGILLPFDSSAPEIVHVACNVFEPELFPIHWICQKEFVGHGPDNSYSACRRLHTIEFERFGLPSKRLDNYLQLIFNDAAAIDGSSPNKYVRPHDGLDLSSTRLLLCLDVCIP